VLTFPSIAWPGHRNDARADIGEIQIEVISREAHLMLRHQPCKTFCVRRGAVAPDLCEVSLLMFHRRNPLTLAPQSEVAAHV
jgi:hypothetical protein